MQPVSTVSAFYRRGQCQVSYSVTKQDIGSDTGHSGDWQHGDGTDMVVRWQHGHGSDTDMVVTWQHGNDTDMVVT